LIEVMLLQTTEIFKLKAAHDSDLSTLKDWLRRSDGGDHFLSGREYGPWEDDNRNDLVSLLSSAHGDKFAQQLWNVFQPAYHRFIGWRAKPHIDEELGKIWEYREESFTLAGNILCVVLSFAIPTGSIFALYYVQPMLARLLIMAAFIFVFAFAMMFVVQSRRGEVFGATAAFAAILVVFVGGVNIIQQR
jgi:hypothetical protein